MVKNSIKVYARLKKERNPKTIADYHISRRSEHEDLTFNFINETDATLNKPHKYRFTKIFDQISTQVEIFNAVAKPIINSVFSGFNGTIFAYGQTGSGKTYAITGSPNEYEDRGILPRSIEQIFEYIKTTSTQYSIYVSYLEIYNEIGYDLLNSKHQPSKLEELPRVALLEDANGEAHLRNLSILPVNNEQEAMRLVFLGDTNRTIAETPMNEYSSRSHCIFTIYITVTSEKSEKIRRSKLHLVDLAGSERIHKSKISGVTLNEAKHINLSLHYLEQVIVALSQTHRSHIPFRNSMMTYILRDSLSGNSLTAMLATLAITHRNIRESLTTCKFSQRVARICTEATINEEIDPQKEILFLRKEVDELRRQLIQLKGINNNEKLNEKQEENCKRIVKEYLKGSGDLPADLGGREMRFCMKLMKDDLERKQREQEERLGNCDSTLTLKYNEIIAQKDEEISILKQLLDATSRNPTASNCPTGDGINPNKFPKDPQFNFSEQEVYRQYRKENGKDIDQMKMTLNKKYVLAKNIVSTVQKCQDNITSIRRKLSCKGNARDVNEKLRSFLLSQQNVYRDSLRQLESLKNETDFLKESVKQAENKLLFKFRQESVQKDDLGEKDFGNLSFGNFNFPGHATNHFDTVSNNQARRRKYEDLSKVDERKLPANISSTLPRTNYLSDSFIGGNDFDFCSKPSLLQFFHEPLNLANDQYFLEKPQFEINPYPTFPIKCDKSNYQTRACDITRRDGRGDSSVLKDSYAYQKEFLDEYHFEKIESTPTRIEENEIKSFSDTTKLDNQCHMSSLKRDGDTPDFLEFMKTVPLTGDIEVDEEIFNFYRSKFMKKS